MEKATIEIWVMVDAASDAAIGLSADEARDSYTESIDGSGAAISRMVKVTLNVPLPVAVEMAGDVPEQSEEGCELVAK